MATFHSTTFQPNTISTLHFMRCLGKIAPHWIDQHGQQLDRIIADDTFRRTVFAKHYSHALAKLIRITGFTSDCRAVAT